MAIFAMKMTPSKVLQNCSSPKQGLYVGLQHVVEPITMNTLRRLGLLKSVFDKYLPPEIWSIVIALLLDRVFAPHHHCSVESFPFYRVQMRRIGNNSFDEGEWRRVRLVCRLWMVLAGPRRVFKQSATTHVIPQGVMVLHCVAHHPYDTFLSQLASNSETGRWLTTLSVAEQDHGSVPTQPSAVSLLLTAGSTVFPNVRSLSLFPSISNSEQDLSRFWPQLELGFPRLISLTLGYSFRGTLSSSVTLQSLEILDMPSYSFSDSHHTPIHLPSLKHLSISRVVGPDQILHDHARQLESLLIHGPTAEILHSGSIWHQLPNLLMVGAPLKDIERVTAPPPDHPLRHICVFAAFEDKEYLFRCKGVLGAFLGIKSFTFFQQRLSSREIRSLRKFAERRGVDIRQLPLLFSARSTLWVQVAAFLYIGLFMLPFAAFRFARQMLGFRW